MLKHRLISSSILIAIVTACVWLDWQFPLRGVGGLWLMPLLLFITFGTAWEMSTLIARAQLPIRRGVATWGALIVILGGTFSLYYPLSGQPFPNSCPVGRVGWVGVSVVIATGLSFLVELWKYKRDVPEPVPNQDAPRQVVLGQVVTRLATSVLVSCYVGAPLACLALVRGLHSGPRGLWDVIGLILVTKCGDIGAYTFGKLMGRRKLIPRVSPGKTWEGLLGGVVFCIAAAYLWFGPLHDRIEVLGAAPGYKAWWAVVVFGVGLALCGLFGDLAESMVKRDTDQKDSGRLLPGLGGVWDVTDSLIGTAVFGYLLIAGGWIG